MDLESSEIAARLQELFVSPSPSPASSGASNRVLDPEGSEIAARLQELFVSPSPSPAASSDPVNSLSSGDDEDFQTHISTLIADEFQRSRPASGLTKRLSTMPPPIQTSASEYPGFDFRSLDYLPDYDSRLMCPICHVPFIEPRRLVCDHIFCNYCFNSHLYTTRGPARDQCPTCRAETTTTTLSVPRVIVNMCNDVKVYCPNRSIGCEDIMTREFAPRHISQCGYERVKCPKPKCTKTTRRKDIADGICRHDTFKCYGCMEIIVAQNPSEHKEQCPASTCYSGGVSRGLEADILHGARCRAANQACPGSAYGCTYLPTGNELQQHTENCLFAKLAPHLNSSAEQISSLKSEIDRQRSEKERLLNGNQRLWEIMIRHIAPAIDDLRSTAQNLSLIPSPPSVVQSPDFSDHPNSRESSHSLPIPSQLPSISHINIANLDQALDMTHPPHPDPVNHLLSLHESLRSDVVSMTSRIDNLTSSFDDLRSLVTESDNRANMMVLNDMLRMKEDLAHTNAALFSTRAQVNWLTRLNGINPSTRQAGFGGNNDGAVNASSNLENFPGPSGSHGQTSSAPEGGRRPSDGHSSQERVKL